MCGRFTFSRSSREISEVFRADAPLGFEARFNISPGQDILVARSVGDKQVLEMRNWGWIPGWADAARAGPRPINARLEGVSRSRAFQDAAIRARCLVPADGFFEWKAQGNVKYPYHITSQSQDWFCFAGLYSESKERDRGGVGTVTILTCKSSDNLRDLHDRMPLAIEKNMFEKWLSDSPDTAIENWALEGIGDWVKLPVHSRVNNVRNDDPACVARFSHQENLELFEK